MMNSALTLFGCGSCGNDVVLERSVVGDGRSRRRGGMQILATNILSLQLAVVLLLRYDGRFQILATVQHVVVFLHYKE